MDNYVLREICEKTRSLEDLFNLSRSGEPMSSIALGVLVTRTEQLKGVAMNRASEFEFELVQAAARNQRDLVRYLLSHTDRHEKIDWYHLYLVAAVSGHVELCEMLCDDKSHPQSPEGLYRGAGESGRLEMCDLAVKYYGCSRKRTEYMGELLLGGAQSGKKEMCIYARQHGAEKCWKMLYTTAKHGHVELCKLAWEWYVEDGAPLTEEEEDEEEYTGDEEEMVTARVLNRILIGGARGGHMGICEWVREEAERRDVTLSWSSAAYHAARGGHDELCEKTREWVGEDFDSDSMLNGAARGGHYDLCLKAREWGGENVEGMLHDATVGGSMSCCRLAIEWGADINTARRAAIWSKNPLMKKWVEGNL